MVSITIIFIFFNTNPSIVNSNREQKRRPARSVMTKKLFILLVLFSFCHVSTQAGQEVVAVQSIRVKPYEKAF
jgi:hypothetical protein